MSGWEKLFLKIVFTQHDGLKSFQHCRFLPFLSGVGEPCVCGASEIPAHVQGEETPFLAGSKPGVAPQCCAVYATIIVLTKVWMECP